MSEPQTLQRPSASGDRWPHRWRTPAVVGLVVAVVAMAPFFLSGSWVQVGCFAMGASIAAIGLNMLVGTAGQLSLAHPFFLAVGAYTYVFVAGDAGTGLGQDGIAGLSAPPIVAAVVAVMLSGIVGALLSPLAGRVRGIYLGIATLALIFLGQHVLLNVVALSGGYNGRAVPEFEFLGFHLADDGPTLYVAGVQMTGMIRIWLVAAFVLAMAVVVARQILRSRVGRALVIVRDSEIAASALGVNVRRAKATIFAVSAMYAGAAGVLLSLAFAHLVPSYFGLTLAVDYIAMIVIGGLGSIGGSICGAAFVTVLPIVAADYANRLSIFTTGALADFGPDVLVRYAYGAAIVLVMIFQPGGLAAIGRKLASFSRTSPLPARPDPAEHHTVRSSK